MSPGSRQRGFRGIIEVSKTNSTTSNEGEHTPPQHCQALPNTSDTYHQSKDCIWHRKNDHIRPAGDEPPRVVYGSPRTLHETSCSRTLPSRHGIRQSPIHCLCSQNPTMNSASHRTRCVRSHCRASTGLAPARRSDWASSSSKPRSRTTVESIFRGRSSCVEVLWRCF